MEKIEAHSWEMNDPTQTLLDQTFLLLWPAAVSAHMRAGQTLGLASVQDVFQTLYPLHWNDTDPLPIAFRPAPPGNSKDRS